MTKTESARQFRQFVYETLGERASEKGYIYHMVSTISYYLGQAHPEVLDRTSRDSYKQLEGRIRRALKKLEEDGLVGSSGWAPRTKYAQRCRIDAEAAQHADERDILAKEKYGESHEIQELIWKAANELHKVAAQGDTRPANLAVTLRSIQEATRDLRSMIERNPKS